MKKIIITLMTLVAVCTSYGQGYVRNNATHRNKDIDKLFQDAVARGANADGVYYIDNRKDKPISVEMVEEYLKESGYYPTTSTKKVIIKFGQSQTLADKVGFTNENGYAKFAFDIMKGDNYRNVSYSQLKPGGSLFYFIDVKHHNEFRRIENVKWSGEVVDGCINGKGVGIVKIDNDWGVFEGEFFWGMAPDPIKIKMSKGGEKRFGDFNWADDRSKWWTIRDCWKNSSDPLFNQAAKKYAANIYDTWYKGKIQDIYNKLLTINTTKYKSFMINRIKQGFELNVICYFRFYDEYNRLYRESRSYDYTGDNSLLVVINEDWLKQFIKDFQGKDLDSQNLIPKAEEVLELIKVADLYHSAGTSGDYVKTGWLFDTRSFDQARVEREIKGFFEVLKITEQKSKSSNASFREFYAKAYPYFKKFESFYRDEFRGVAYDNYLRAQGKYYAEMCDNCKIDGDKTTIPTGYKPEDKGIFFSTPAQSEKDGRIQMHNGKVVYWKYIYDGKYTKIETIGDLGSKIYSSKEEMMEGIIKTCKDKYCK